MHANARRRPPDVSSTARAAALTCALLALCAFAAYAADAQRLHLGPRVPAQVERVVTLAPSLTEMVLALGAGERLVGVTRFDDDPRVAKVARIGGYNDPEPEAVLLQRPDLVVAEPAPANRGPVEALSRLGVPVEAFPLHTVSQIEETLRSLGALLGRRAQAEALLASMERAREEARARAARGPHPRTLLVFGLDPLVVGGPAGFAGELLEDAGGSNVAADREKPFSRMSEEAAVAARPEVLILCGVEPEKGRPVLHGFEAVRVARLRSTALLHPGPRVPEALSDLAAALSSR
jgi:iron complex transport system substrate-binding protein